MPKDRYLLDIELLPDKKFDTNEDYVILTGREWRIVESWIKLCKRAGVLEKGYEPILDTTVWPLTVHRHTAFDA